MARTRIVVVLAAVFGGAAAALFTALFLAGGAEGAPTCTIYWTGATSTSWGTAGNWSPTDGGAPGTVVPGVGDYVCMSTNPTRQSVVASSANRTINGINFAKTGTVTPSLELQGSTFTINTNVSTINNLTVDGGTLGGSAATTFTGTLAMPSGTVAFTGTGTKTVGTGASFIQSVPLNIGVPTPTPAGGTPVVNSGSWTLNASLAPATQASSAPSSLTNNGTFTINDGAVINGNGGGSNLPFFVNSGSVVAQTSSAFALQVPFTNAGTVSVGASDLSLTYGNAPSTSDTGVWSANAAGHIVFAADRSITSGSITGTTGAQVAGGTTTFGAAVTASTLDLQSGGTVAGSPTVTKLLLNGGTLNGSGTLTASGTNSLACGVNLTGGYTLLNTGTLTYTHDCGYVSFAGGATLKNNGTLAITDTSGCCGYFSDDGSGTGGVLNTGTITVALSDPSYSIGVYSAFSNLGTVTVSTGRLNLLGGNVPSSPDTGTYTVAASGRILSSGTRSFPSGSVSGSGAYDVTGGAVTFGSTVTVSHLALDGGTVSGSPTVAMAELTGGTLDGSGTMTTTAATSTLCGVTLSNGYTLSNTGTLSWTRDCGYLQLTTASTMLNSGTLAITGTSSGGNVFDDGTANSFRNTGTITLKLDAATSVLQIYSAFTNDGSVTVTTGELDLLAGNTAANPGDTGTYSIASGGEVALRGGLRTVNSGTVTGSGLLAVSGADVSFAAGVAISNLEVDSGSVAGSPLVTNLTLNGGTLDGTGTLTASGANSTLCGITISGGYTLVNSGTLSWNRDCGYVQLTDGSVLSNSGTFAVTGTSGGGYEYDDGGAANAFLNSGTLTLTLDATSSQLDFYSPFTNTGTVSVVKGVLELTSGNATSAATDTGTWSIAAGSIVRLVGGSRAIAATGSVSGAGTLVAGGAAVTFGSGTPVSNLRVTSGSVSGSPTVVTALLDSGTLTGSGTLTATGAGSTICGPTIDSGYTVLNQGAMAYALSGCYVSLTNGSKLENAGSMPITGNAGYVNSDGTAANTFVNDATGSITVTLSAAATEEQVYAPFTNNGTLTVTKGKFTPQAGITNLTAGGKLTGGSWIANGGTLNLPNAVTNNAATIVLGATGSISPALTGVTTNSGSLTVAQILTESTALANSGTVIAAGGTWRVNSYAQSAGSTTVASGATFKSGTTGTGAVTISAGALGGTGTVQGAVGGAGTVAPGSAGTGTLTVTGTYANPAAGTLAVVPTGTQLATSGTATLAGTLAITTPTPVPAIGTSTTILSASSVSGTFSSVTGQDVPSANAFWQVKYNAGSVTLGLTAYPTVSVAGASGPEGNSATSNQGFTVSLSGPSPLTTTVNYATSDGTATAPADYTATSGTVMFAPGQTTQTVNVPVVGDTVYEHDETYTLTLTAPVRATLGTAVATGAIVNDDTAPVISVGNAGTSVYGAAGGTITFPVTLSAASGVAASVNYATADGSAIAGSDYTATSGTLTIPAGATTASITVTALPKAPYAAPKSFALNLSAPVDATLAGPSATGTITNINDAVTSITPKGQVFTGATRTLTLNGVNFAAGSTVSVSGSGVLVSAVTVVDAQTITAKFFAQATAPTGLRTVTVASPGHGSAACANCLRVSPTPTATAVSPNIIPRGTSSPVSLTITGTNFATGAKVSFVPNHGMIVAGGSSNVVSSTTITLSVTAKQYAALGLYKVNVTNPDSGLASCANCLSVQGPAISSVSPNVIRRGVPTTITISGSAFDPAAVVSGTACATTTNSVTATSISATVSCGTNAPLGKRSVTVTNPDGGAYICTNCLNLGGPNITAISPASVQRGTTTNLTITGTGFANGATLAITGTCTFSAVTVTGPTGMTATITCPSNAGTGSRQITVTNPASAGSGVGVYNGFAVTT